MRENIMEVKKYTIIGQIELAASFMCENLPMRKRHIGLGARKFSCAKIPTFTVC